MEHQILAPPVERAPWKQQRRGPAKRFLEAPADATFAQIRQRLQRLTLNSEYKKGLEHFNEANNAQNVNKFHNNRTLLKPQRVSSFGSKDSIGSQQRVSSFGSKESIGSLYAKEQPKPAAPVNRPTRRPPSKDSFFSDDIEYENVRKRIKEYYNRYGETDQPQLSPTRDGIITPKRNPELFASQIRLKDRPVGERPRVSSPKSRTSDSSSGRVHLGLIDCLDLKEPLSDLDKLKERYSSNEFMSSLTLYKLRGHDRCFYPDATHSDHVPRGTLLYHSGDKIGPSDSPDSMKGSLFSLPSVFKEPPYNSPQSMQHTHHEWRGPGHGQSKESAGHWRKIQQHGSVQVDNKKKRVEFDVTPRATNVALPPISPFSNKEPKSILKKREGTPETVRSLKKLELQSVSTDEDDEFLVTPRHGWKYHIPRLHSPAPSTTRKHPNAFRGKMYHFGDGISHEFETVIDKYGNCRQNSMLREQSAAKSKK